MKRSRCERFASPPASGSQAGYPGDTAPAAGESAASADDGQLADPAPAAELPPMSFPGPFAFAPLPAGAPTPASVIAPHSLPPLLLAAGQGCLDEVLALLRDGSADVDEVDDRHGSSTLSLAASNGHAAVVAALLDAGAAVNLHNARTDATALVAAACRGHLEVIRVLLRHPRIDIDRRGRSGGTALMQASWADRPAVVACLLDAGADANLADRQTGVTSLIGAAGLGHVEVARLLLRHPGINVDQANHSGSTALIFAAWNNRPAIVSSLLAAGAQVNLASARNAATALTGAAGLGHIEAVRILLAHPGTAVD